jgi:hypothetical protein
MGTKKTGTTSRQFADGLNALHKLGHAKITCANCRTTLPGAYGTPGVSLARFDNQTLLCSECGTAEAFSNSSDCIVTVSKWFNLNIDSHSVYSHAETALKFLQETGQLADWPTATYKETVQSMRNDPRGGSMEKALKDKLVCYGWIMARHMAFKLVKHESHMMGRGFEFRDCVSTLAKAGF